MPIVASGGRTMLPCRRPRRRGRPGACPHPTSPPIICLLHCQRNPLAHHRIHHHVEDGGWQWVALCHPPCAHKVGPVIPPPPVLPPLPFLSISTGAASLVAQPRSLLRSPGSWTCPRRHTPWSGSGRLRTGPPPSWPQAVASLDTQSVIETIPI